MKIKIDENLPSRLAGILNGIGHDAHTVHEELLTGRDDQQIWNVVQKESRFFITQDLGFSDLRRFAPGSHHGILLVRLRSPSSSYMIERIRQLFQNENIAGWYGCLIVATERKIRVSKPPIN
jgi:predicted nuclease of predicted toxin-antitoxin system